MPNVHCCGSCRNDRYCPCCGRRLYPTYVYPWPYYVPYPVWPPVAVPYCNPGPAAPWLTRLDLTR